MNIITVTLYNEQTGDLVDVCVSTYNQLLNLSQTEFRCTDISLYHDGNLLINLDNVVSGDIIKVVSKPDSGEPARYDNIYISGTINNFKIKMIVDSGAQVTMMTLQLAQQLNIAHLIDKSYAGIAKGMGTAHIIGRILSYDVNLAQDFSISMDITVADIDDPVLFLIGLDFLYPNKCALNFDTNMLYTKKHQIPLLSSSEIKNLCIPVDTVTEKIHRSYRNLKSNLSYKFYTSTSSVLKKIIGNILANPTVDKYQRVNIYSKTFADIYKNPFCKAFINTIGFEETSDDHLQFNDNKCTLLAASKVLEK